MDTARARVYCPLCGMVEYCDDHLRCMNPPLVATGVIKARHTDYLCRGRSFFYSDAGEPTIHNLTERLLVVATRTEAKRRG